MPNTHDLDLSARAEKILNSRASVGLALGVVRPDGLEQFHAHGVADVTTRQPVTADTVFRVASITKTFTAVAVMQLWEQGRLDLDSPASEYLRAYAIVPGQAEWPPATLRHLLTHTAGIGEEVPRTAALRRDFGESVPADQPVPTLAEHYGGELRLDTEPGTRFRYTDHGPATLGQVVEDVSGMPFAQYLRKHVFAPLGMFDTDLERSDRFLPRLATGYTLGSRGAGAVPDRAWVTAGASSAYSTPRDMARYVAALLGGGTNEHGTVLGPSTVAAMFAPGYRPDPRLPGTGLAFCRANAGEHPTVDHQGNRPGFDSPITLAPEDGVGVIAFSTGTRLGSLWMPSEAGRMLATLLGAPEDGVRDDVPHRPETWQDICGWYYLPGPISDLRARLMVGAGVEVRVRRGRLVLRGLTPVPLLAKGFPLHPDDPDDPYLFRIDLSEYDLGSLRVAFSQDESGNVDAVHLDVMPLSAYKRAETSNPRRWAEGVAALGATAVIGRRLRRTRAD
jgi:CubicO group peptidase (beta-lactamase class C family)